MSLEVKPVHHSYTMFFNIELLLKLVLLKILHKLAKKNYIYLVNKLKITKLVGVWCVVIIITPSVPLRSRHTTIGSDGKIVRCEHKLDTLLLI